MAPRRPPVDLSEPLPASTSPPVNQADLQAILAAIEDLNSRVSAEADDMTAPATATTSANRPTSPSRSVLAAVSDGLETSTQSQRVLVQSVTGLTETQSLSRDGAHDWSRLAAWA
ncbi:MAG: hypothetical protein OXQ84_18655 [bacterium]|nr:hypothetical protein [bacterium]